MSNNPKGEYYSRAFSNKILGSRDSSKEHMVQSGSAFLNHSEKRSSFKSTASGGNDFCSASEIAISKTLKNNYASKFSSFRSGTAMTQSGKKSK